MSRTKKFQGCEVNRVHGVAAVGQERQLRRDKYPGSYSETNSATAEGEKKQHAKRVVGECIGHGSYTTHPLIRKTLTRNIQ